MSFCALLPTLKISVAHTKKIPKVMYIDTRATATLRLLPTEASAAEGDGFDGIWASEGRQDPFLMSLLAAEHTERLQIGTGIAVAFARNPMTVAQSAWDLNRFSSGRFVVGLGSQVRGHIERRFSMPWSHPVDRMREFIAAMHAIWDCWTDGRRLDFRGDFYQHTLMSPMFSGIDSEWGAPKVFLAAVGPFMTRLAGEACDGLSVHSFTTSRYLTEVTVPALEEGLDLSNRPRSAIEVSCPAFVATGHSEKEVVASAGVIRRQLAAYASTPTYRPVLDLHGWGDLQPDLNERAKRGEWELMGEGIDNEMLDTFAVVDTPDAIPGRLMQRFGGIVDRLTLHLPTGVSSRDRRQIIRGLRGEPSEGR